MATYTELDTLAEDATLLGRIGIALMIAAQGLVDGTPEPQEKRWAHRTLSNADVDARRVLRYLLAANKDATVAAITGVTDAAIQTQVDALVPTLVAGR